MSNICTHDILNDIDGIECPLCQVEFILKQPKNKTTAASQQRAEKIQTIVIGLHKHIESEIAKNGSLTLERNQIKIDQERQFMIFDSEYYLVKKQIRLAASNKVLKHIERAVNVCLKTYLTTDSLFVEYFKLSLKNHPKRIIGGKPHFYLLIIKIFKGLLVRALGQFREPSEEKSTIDKFRQIHLKKFNAITESQLSAAIEHVVDEVVDLIKKDNDIKDNRISKIQIDSFLALQKVGYALVAGGGILLFSTLLIHVLLASGIFKPLHPGWLHLTLIIPSLSCIYFGIRELRRNLSKKSEIQDMEIVKTVNEMLERVSSIAKKANETADPIIDLGKKIKNLLSTK